MIKAIGLYGSLFFVTSVTKIFHIFFLIICIIILQLTAYYSRKRINLANFSLDNKKEISNTYYIFLIKWLNNIKF